MRLKIGTSYAVNVERLKFLIGTDEIDEMYGYAEFHCCYFCRKPIRGRMVTLILNEPDPFTEKEEYYLHESCHKETLREQRGSETQ